LLETVDTPLDHGAAPIAFLVKLERAPRPARPALALILPLGNRVRDAPLPQLIATLGIAAAFIRDQLVRPLARPPAVARPGDANRVQHRLQPRAVMALPGGEHHGQGPPPPVAGQGQLGR